VPVRVGVTEMIEGGVSTAGVRANERCSQKWHLASYISVGGDLGVVLPQIFIRLITTMIYEVECNFKIES
jgi:hypothetical protein